MLNHTKSCPLKTQTKLHEDIELCRNAFNLINDIHQIFADALHVKIDFPVVNIFVARIFDTKVEFGHFLTERVPVLLVRISHLVVFYIIGERAEHNEKAYEAYEKYDCGRLGRNKIGQILGDIYSTFDFGHLTFSVKEFAEFFQNF